ncbi:MAG: hypothetical protein GC160_13810 [Acidobacteria bacterium]|nr:hypothetical protein [Acidobacteriota bacterium]
MLRITLLVLFILCPLSLVRAQNVTVVSAASFAQGYPVAPNSIASAFGVNLAPGTEAATMTPLPTVLQGASVTIIDSAGQNHTCPLFFVSPGQINFLVPDGVATGTASIRVGPAASTLTAEGAAQSLQTGQFEVAPYSTGLFTVSDQEWMAGFILRVDADGTQTYLPTVELDANNQVVPVPLEMSPNGDESAQFYVIAYGTGNRAAAEGDVVRSFIGLSPDVSEGDEIPTLFNGAQGGFVGLDQTNAGPIPRRLENFGGGDRPFSVAVNDDLSNAAWIQVAPNPNAPTISNPTFELVSGSPPRMVYELDFTDADGDFGPFEVVWFWEDETRYCLSGLQLPEGPQTGQTSGRTQFSALKSAGTQLGTILSVSISVADAAGHISNLLEYAPDPPGSLGGFAEPCQLVIGK